MKKLLYSLALILGGTSFAFAEDVASGDGTIFTIWPTAAEQGKENAQDVELISNSNVFNMKTCEVSEDDSGKFYRFATNPDGPYALFGFGTNTDCTEAVKGNYDLVFDIRSTDDFNFYMKMEINGLQDEYLFDFVRDGNWQTVKIPLDDFYTRLVTSYTEYDSSKTNYFFEPVIKGPGDSSITQSYTFDVKNIRLEPMAREAVEADTTYYGYSVIESPYLALIEYEIKINEAVGDDGQTFTIFANFSSTDASGFNHQLQIDRPGYALIEMEYNPQNFDETGYEYSYTAKNNYYEHDILNFQFIVPVEGGVLTQDVSYVFGWKNDPIPPKPIVIYKLVERSYNSATISFQTLLPKALENSNVKFYYEGEEISNPWAITGLTEETDYTYEVVAIAQKDNEPYKSDPVEISFWTSKKDATDKIFFGEDSTIFEGFYTDKSGSSENRLTKRINFEYSITHTSTGQLILDIIPDYDEYLDIVGFVPRMIIFPENGNDRIEEVSMAKTLSVTSNQFYKTGDKLRIQLFFDYNNGTAQINIYYTVGETSDAKLRLSTGVITAYTAEIYYNLLGLDESEITISKIEYKDTNSETYTVWNGGNPILVENLKENTEYTYDVNIFIEGTPEPYTSSISFSTIKFVPDAEGVIGNIWKGEIKGTTSRGEDFSASYEIPYYIIVNQNKTFTIFFNFISDPKEIAGLVKEVYIDDLNNAIQPRESTNSEYPFCVDSDSDKNYEPGQEIKCKFYFPYANGGSIAEEFVYVFGSSNTGAVMGELSSAEWHPAEIVIKDIIALPDGDYSDKNFIVTVTPNGHETWTETPTQANTGLNEWDWNVYSEITAASKVTALDGKTGENKCDGYLINPPTGSLSEGTEINGVNHLNLVLNVDCSGLYDVTVTPVEGSGLKIGFEGGAAMNSLTQTISIYPSFTHTYTYKHGNNDEKEDALNINDYFIENGSLSYNSSTEAKDILKNAKIYIPGLYDADIYYWISDGDNDRENGNEPTPDTTGKEPSLAKAVKNSSLPTGYEMYTNKVSNGDVVDLSALATSASPSLNLVAMKNGAVTPIERDGTSLTAIPVIFDDNTPNAVDSVEVTDSSLVDIYTLSGVPVAKSVNFDEVKSLLAPGIYIIGKQKVLIR